MIKAVILDVDGVIVGDKPGFNFPLPHQQVIQKFKEIQSKGIPVVLCTGKFSFAILEIIKQANLRNPHITDGGALIIDPLDKKVIKKHLLDKDVLKTCISNCLRENIYIELYTSTACYMQKSQVSDLTPKRASILQMQPTQVNSLLSVIETEDIIKMLIFAKDNNDIPRAEEIIEKFHNKINLVWTYHPYTAPVRPGIITAPNVSKAHAVKEVAASLGTSFDEILGIGDTAGDWNFMELCKYVATLDNGEEKIKTLVKTKGEGNYFIAPHIDENGVLDILKYFSL